MGSGGGSACDHGGRVRLHAVIEIAHHELEGGREGEREGRREGGRKGGREGLASGKE